MSGCALYIAVTAQYIQQTQARNDSETLYRLSSETARQAYCIDYNIRPCTQDAVNASAASRSHTP